MSLLYSPSFQLKGHCSPITVMTFNTSGSLLASGDEDGVVMIWTVSSGTVASIIAPMDAITALHFTTTISDQNETIAVGTKGGLLVGYEISNDDSGHDNAREIYCAKYSDYPLVAITSAGSFVVVVNGIQPTFHHAGQFCLRLYTLDGPHQPSLKLDPVWKRRMSGGQPKMVNMYFEKYLEIPTVDVWLHSGVLLRFRQKNSMSVKWKVIRQLNSDLVSLDMHSNRTLISFTSGATELHTDNLTTYRSLAALRVPLDASNRVEFRDRSVSHCILIEDGRRALCGTVDGKLMIYDLDDDQTSIPAYQVLCHGDQDVAYVASRKLQCLAASSNSSTRIHLISSATKSATPSVQLWTRLYSGNEQTMVEDVVRAEEGRGTDDVVGHELDSESDGVRVNTPPLPGGVDEYPESSEEEPDEEEESMRRLMMQRAARAFAKAASDLSDVPTESSTSATDIVLSAQLSLLLL